MKPKTGVRLSLAHKTPTELLLIAKRSENPERVREIIDHVRVRFPYDIRKSLLGKLKVIDRRLSKRPPPVEKKQTQEKPALTSSLSKAPPPIVDRFSSKPLSDTLAIWRNCIANLADPAKKVKHKEALNTLQEIRQHWRNRPFSESDYFNWPSTIATPGLSFTSSGHWMEKGLLVCFGYRVGNIRGVSRVVRQAMLREIFLGPLPPVFPPQYLEKWGREKTAPRLKQLAETLAAFTRNNKRRRSNSYEKAIGDYEDDLEFLHDTFYIGHFGFGWPTTAIK